MLDKKAKPIDHSAALDEVTILQEGKEDVIAHAEDESKVDV